jgi:hypothetical protein
MESSALGHLYAIEVQNSPTISYATVTFRNWIPAVRETPSGTVGIPKEAI